MTSQQNSLEQLAERWYDTKEGVLASMSSLASFHRLIDARCRASYVWRERLQEHLALDGAYVLDSSGNIGARIKDDAYAMHVHVPLPHVLCGQCGKGWTIENVTDAVVDHGAKVIKLDESGTNFVGKTLADVKAHFAGRTDAEYFMQKDMLIRNPANIDLTPIYANPESDIQRQIVKNEHGWLAEWDGVTDGYVIKPNDEGNFNVWRFFHKQCYSQALANAEEQRVNDVFAASGFKYFKITPTKNSYSDGVRDAPWYRVNTDLGSFLIGRRFRVINIDWSGECARDEGEKTPPAKDLSHLFKDENVTVGPTYIHAGSWPKVREYLMRIREHLAG